MGLATIISASINLVYLSPHYHKPGLLYFLWAVWWIDVVVTVATLFGIPYVLWVTYTCSRYPAY
jgi:predicted membrane metal-binding protein